MTWAKRLSDWPTIWQDGQAPHISTLSSESGFVQVKVHTYWLNEE